MTSDNGTLLNLGNTCDGLSPCLPLDLELKVSVISVKVPGFGTGPVINAYKVIIYLFQFAQLCGDEAVYWFSSV